MGTLPSTLDAGHSDQSFCPECGQPLNLRHPHAGSTAASPVSWRSIVLVGVGLYLLSAFGLDLFRANRMLQAASACPEPGWGKACEAPPHDLTLAIAFGRLTTADAFAVRSAELELGRDTWLVVVGLVCLVVAAVAVRLRATRRRSDRPPEGAHALFAAESLLALVFAQVGVICAYHLLLGTITGTPLTRDAVEEAVNRTISTAVALIGTG